MTYLHPRESCGSYFFNRSKFLGFTQKLVQGLWESQSDILQAKQALLCTTSIVVHVFVSHICFVDFLASVLPRPEQKRSAYFGGRTLTKKQCSGLDRLLILIYIYICTSTTQKHGAWLIYRPPIPMVYHRCNPPWVVPLILL